jgi:hypothetical protein
MSINFNNSFYSFNKPHVAHSGSKSVREKQKDRSIIDFNNYKPETSNIIDDLFNIADTEQKPEVKATSDSQSAYAASSFETIADSYNLTPGEVMALYSQFALQVSNNAPEAKQQLDLALGKALFKSFMPVVTMDSQSASAISNFKTALDASFTEDEMVELFVRFSREISINYPEAWNELVSILNNNIPSAFKPDMKMDSQAAIAISNFRSSINPELTRAEMIELFVRFSREISIKYPDAWNELSGILANSMASAYVPDNTMDSQSRHAISNFRSTINSELTKDEMIELFVRFSREISVKFPDAWKELTGVLNNNLSIAFKPDTSMDSYSQKAVSDFKTALDCSMTKDQMIETFIRFSRMISVKYPDAWKDLEGTLAQHISNAFKPVTTIDENSRDLAIEFVNKVDIEDLSTQELEDLFGEYLKQISLKFVDAKKKVESAYQGNIHKSLELDKDKKQEENESTNVVKEFKNVIDVVNRLDNNARNLSFELSRANKKDEINKKMNEIKTVETSKELLDINYSRVMTDARKNPVTFNTVNDTYIQDLNISKDSANDRELQEMEMQELTRWDMLREMRREEVLDILNNQKKDDLTEQLISIPKFLLKRILLNQVHDEQCRILMSNKFPESILRKIPEGNAIKQLPKAEDLLPILLMTGQLSNGQTGMELMKNIIAGDTKTERPQNATRAREEIEPYMAEMMLNKPAKLAELAQTNLFASSIKPDLTDSKINKLTNDNKDLIGKFLNPEDTDKEMSAGRRDNKVDSSDDNKKRLPRLELLSIGQLLQLAKDKVSELSDDEANDMFRAKRGGNKEIFEFLDALENVDSLAGAKLAVAVLYNNQQELLKQAILPHMNKEDMVKLTLNFGKDKDQMVREMPWYAIQDQIKELPKAQMVESFKLLPKSETIGAFGYLPSQVIAGIAFDALDRNTVSDNLFHKKGFAAA